LGTTDLAGRIEKDKMSSVHRSLVDFVGYGRSGLKKSWTLPSLADRVELQVMTYRSVFNDALQCKQTRYRSVNSVGWRQNWKMPLRHPR